MFKGDAAQKRGSVLSLKQLVTKLRGSGVNGQGLVTIRRVGLRSEYDLRTELAPGEKQQLM